MSTPRPAMVIRVGDATARLTRDLTWETEDSALRAQLRRFTHAYWERSVDPRFQPRETAYALAYLAAGELGGDVIEEIEAWGYPESDAPEGAVH